MEYSSDHIDIKKNYPDFEMVLHTDQSSVYASKSLNELLPIYYNIIHSMSRFDTPTDNATMEAVNGWGNAEIFCGFHITSNENIGRVVIDHITFLTNKDQRIRSAVFCLEIR